MYMVFVLSLLKQHPQIFFPEDSGVTRFALSNTVCQFVLVVSQKDKTHVSDQMPYAKLSKMNCNNNYPRCGHYPNENVTANVKVNVL